MSTHDHDLLQAAARLIRHRSGQRGRLPSAYIRRSVSTAYYAVFHFLLDEAARILVGTHHDLRRRRRTSTRMSTHAGVRLALDRVDWSSPRGGAPDRQTTMTSSRACVY